MRFTRLVAALSLVASAGAAHAAIGSPFPGNYVDDFGQNEPASLSSPAEERPTAYASMIPANYIDEFGSETASGPASTEAVPEGHASIIPGNNIDDFSVPADTTSTPSTVAAWNDAPAPRS